MKVTYFFEQEVNLFTHQKDLILNHKYVYVILLTIHTFVANTMIQFSITCVKHLYHHSLLEYLLTIITVHIRAHILN